MNRTASLLPKCALIGAFAWAGLTLEPDARADIQGETVMHGNVQFVHDGDRILIYASNGSIIHYTQFSVEAWETIQFIQPGALSRVLNRITGNDPTQIDGTLLANGRVYIVNPAGVYFGNGALVDVGALYAAAGHIDDADFLDGNDRFTNLDGEIVNHGLIRAHDLYLLGERVANHGLIRADGGVVALVAGDEIHLQRIGDRISVRVDGHEITGQSMPMGGTTTPNMLATPGVENTGDIRNHGGEVVLGAGDLYALAIRNTGTVRARGGDVTIAAADGLVQNDGLIKVSSEGGSGTITMQGPSILNRGALRADGGDGRVEVTSQRHTFLSDGSLITAKGGLNSDAGSILVHSYQGETIFSTDSRILAQGGRFGGHGGFVEISGSTLTLNGRVRLDARGGWSDGTLLIDPVNIVINDLGGDDAVINDGIITFDEMPGSNSYIAASTLEAIQGLIHLQATGSIFFDVPVDLQFNNDLLLEAYGAITIREPISGANNVHAFADFDGDTLGFVTLNTSLDIGGDVVLSGYTVRFNGASLTAGGTIEVFGPALLGADVAIHAPMTTFHDTVDARDIAPDKALSIFGDVRFEDRIGAADQLRFLEVDGSAFLASDLVQTRLHQTWNGDLSLDTSIDFLSAEGGDITFDGTVDNAGENAVDLNVLTSGRTSFLGEIGGQGELGRVWTDSPGDSHLAGTIHAGMIEFNDALSLGGDSVLDGSEWVIFRDSIAGESHDLRVNAPLTRFDGAVTGVGFLRTDADGQTHVNGGTIDAQRVALLDDVLLESDTHIRGADSVEFGGRVDSGIGGGAGEGGTAAHLIVESDHSVLFGDDVGGESPLGSLIVELTGANDPAGNLIRFDGDAVRALGNIELDPSGLSEPWHVASIVGGGNLLIESFEGHVLLGENHKLTALGDLTLRALAGSITVGDLNAAGDLSVTAPTIFVRLRPDGSAINGNGATYAEGGTDFIALGDISLEGDLTFIGNGDALRVASAGGAISGSLMPYAQGFTTSATAASFTRSFFGAGSQLVLDLDASEIAPPPPPPPPPPTPTLSDVNLAEQLPDGPRRVRDRVFREPFALRSMDRLAIYLRGFSAEELHQAAQGIVITVDTSPTRVAPGGPITISAHRLRRSSVIQVLSRHEALLGPNDRQEAAAAEIRAILGAAATDYAQAGGGSSVGFAQWAMESDAHAAAAGYLAGIGELLAEVRRMGAAPSELRAIERSILAPLTPGGMNTAQIRDASLAAWRNQPPS